MNHNVMMTYIILLVTTDLQDHQQRLMVANHIAMCVIENLFNVSIL